jgi:uncharacterized protein YpmB
MTTILLLVLDVIMAAIAYLLYVSVFVPYQSKNAAYAKLKAKEKLELDRKLEVEHYFGVKSMDENQIDIPVKIPKLNFFKKKKIDTE